MQCTVEGEADLQAWMVRKARKARKVGKARKTWNVRQTWNTRKVCILQIYKVFGLVLAFLWLTFLAALRLWLPVWLPCWLPSHLLGFLAVSLAIFQDAIFVVFLVVFMAAAFVVAIWMPFWLLCLLFGSGCRSVWLCGRLFCHSGCLSGCCSCRQSDCFCRCPQLPSVLPFRVSICRFFWLTIVCRSVCHFGCLQIVVLSCAWTITGIAVFRFRLLNAQACKRL